MPGDKSISHRALILGALAIGETNVSGLLESQDIMSTVNALRELGVEVEPTSPKKWKILGRVPVEGGLSCKFCQGF